MAKNNSSRASSLPICIFYSLFAGMLVHRPAGQGRALLVLLPPLPTARPLEAAASKRRAGFAATVESFQQDEMNYIF